MKTKTQKQQNTGSQRAPKYSTDTLMLDLMASLCHDAKSSLGLTEESYVFNAMSSRNVRCVRGAQFLLSENMTVDQYKWSAQLNSLLKRYTFQNDIYTPQEREELTNAKFLKLQETLAANYWRPRSFRCHQVIRRARQIVRRVLDGFDPQGDIQRGRFGTKATVECPATHAYIDEKLLHRPLTGSRGHIQWLNNAILPNDQLLCSILKDNRHGYSEVWDLAQVNVPKKFNIDRGINPNTLFGSLYSDIIGRNIEAALRKEGLDIKKLQHKHGVYAEQASTHGRWATADMSDASHGFLSNLLNALLPRKWYRAVMFGVIRSVEVDGRVSRLESIMTMGIGFTFPMQTLLFYCLLLAIRDLSQCMGKISVYGDDLVYPTKMHKYVVGIFKDLGFKLNLDKTFVHSHFRESCGSDYFKGEMVRPFAPEEEGRMLTADDYAAFCYKLLNGLLRRWDIHQIKTCVFLLCSKICDVKSELFVVTKDDPDFSGLKLANSEYHNDVIWYMAFPTAVWVWDTNVMAYKYPHLRTKVRRHYVSDCRPYYWDALRQLAKREAETILPLTPLPIPGTPTLTWRSNKRKKTYVIDSLGQKRRRKYATVTKKEHVTRYTVTPARELIAPREDAL